MARAGLASNVQARNKPYSKGGRDKAEGCDSHNHLASAAWLCTSAMCSLATATSPGETER